MLYAIHFSLSRCAISLNLHKLSDYITTLLTRAREISIEVYLQATAATFREAWRLVDAIIKVAAERNECMVTRARAEDVVYVVLSVPPLVVFACPIITHQLIAPQVSNVRDQYG
jgi:hypothetical protein